MQLIDKIFTPMNMTLMILIVSSVLFMSGKIRSDIVALCSLLALVLLNILTPTQALAGFSNPVVLMMVGLFIVGGGIFRTGLAKLISAKILKLSKGSENKLFILVMLVTSIIGAFVSNTGTVAVMIPIVVSIAMSLKISPRKFLMPLAFASSMGGMLTLIGTPPNMIVSEELKKNGFEGLSFFSFTPVGLVCLAVGIVGLAILSKLFLSGDDGFGKERKQGKTLFDLADEYQLRKLKHLRLLDKSKLSGKKLKDLKISSLYNISVITVVKFVNNSPFSLSKHTLEIIAGPDTVLESGDVLVCYGKKDDIDLFIEDNNLIFQDELLNSKNIFDFENIGLAEVFILPNSKLVNRTISDTHFRDEFNVNILGIQRNDEYKMSDLQNEKLHAGDALLIQGTWDNIANLGNRQDDLVLVGQPLEEASKVTLDYKAPIAALIMILMVVGMVSNIVAPVIAVLIAAVLMVLTGCLRNMEEAYQTINWGSVVLIAGMMPMALAFEQTGAANLISDLLVNGLGKYGPYALLSGIYIGTSILTLFVSNTATTLLFAPIGIQAAHDMGVSPYPFMFAITVAASMCFASPFSTTSNALVMSAGHYSFSDYIKVGLPLQIVMGIVIITILPLLFPF